MDPFLNMVLINIKEEKLGGTRSLQAEAGEQEARTEVHKGEGQKDKFIPHRPDVDVMGSLG